MCLCSVWASLQAHVPPLFRLASRSPSTLPCGQPSQPPSDRGPPAKKLGEPVSLLWTLMGPGDWPTLSGTPLANLLLTPYLAPTPGP